MQSMDCRIVRTFASKKLRQLYLGNLVCNNLVDRLSWVLFNDDVFQHLGAHFFVNSSVLCLLFV